MYRLLTAILLAVTTGVLAGIFLIVAVGFLVGALYLFLLTSMSAPLAALATGGAALAVACLALIAGRFISARARRSRRRKGVDENRLAEELGEMLGRDVASFVCTHARSSVLVALLVGLAVGVNPRLRESLLALLKR